jgi:hypothetical protein
MDDGKQDHELLTLSRMARRLRLSQTWLRTKAEAGEIPGLKADRRWLFRADVVEPIVSQMAEKSNGGAKQ